MSFTSTATGLTAIRDEHSEPTNPAHYGYDKDVQALREQFATGKTRDIAWRKQQLNQLVKMINESHEEIVEAMAKDLGGGKLRSLFEMAFVEDAHHALKHLDSWAAPQQVPNSTWLGKSEIRKVPKGVVLMISPWNFPIALVFGPLVAAISAGNCALIKPSEMSPHCSALVDKLVNKYLDTSCIMVRQGAVPETTALLKLKWDHIFYTGNGVVGRVVMRAAAEFLTPVTIELGGKSPVVVDDTAKIDTAVERILMGKFTNMGQICIAPDYILVHESVEKQFVKKMIARAETFYGNDPKSLSHVGRIIHERHVKRVERLVNSTTGKVIHGGSDNIDYGDRFMVPTLVHGPGEDDAIMSEEIFGPVLPIIKFKDLPEAVARINKIYKTPLALYIFSEKTANIEYVLDNTQSGGVCVNSTIEHIAGPHVPFGGVGDSGFGSYHGKFGFDELSHARSVVYKDTLFTKDWILPAPPHPEWLYDVALRMNITGFLTPEQKTALKVAAVAAVGAASFHLSKM